MRHRALGLVELTGWSPTLLALDAMEKAGDVQLLQIELNDFLGACIKITGGVSDVRAAVDAARAMASRMGVDIAADVIPAPDEKIWPVVQAKAEFSPLLESNVVYFPQVDPGASENTMADNASFAIGMIETQGLTAVLEAIDCACKAAAVDVVGREKLGGGYVTVIIKGDVAAVKAAVAAGREAVDGLGKLIAAHVIARPSEGVLSLLPKS
ncbi:MAG TPA: BMC domain-containing protein [Tepidisphaeraceae bacterium]|jgi:microcompartment protein CcmL/EutN